MRSVPFMFELWMIVPFAVLLVVGVFGGAGLLFVGGRFIVKSPKATFGRCLVIWAIAFLAGLAICTIPMILWVPAFLVMWIPALLVVWLIIKVMLKVSFGQAILAWLPTLGLAVLLGPLLVSILLPALNVARGQAKQAVCAANINGLGMAMMIYASENTDIYPPTLDYLVQNGQPPKMLDCPGSDRQGNDYLYVQPSVNDAGTKIVLCDRPGNHYGRVCALQADCKVLTLDLAEFEALLARPENAPIRALWQAEAPNAARR